MSNKKNKRVQEYSMQIRRNHSIENAFRACWEDSKAEFNLNDDSYISLMDWCTKEIYSRALAPQRVYIEDHYRSDEGRCIIDAWLYPQVDILKRDFTYYSIKNWVDCKAKLLVLGKDVVIAKLLD